MRSARSPLSFATPSRTLWLAVIAAAFVLPSNAVTAEDAPKSEKREGNGEATAAGAEPLYTFEKRHDPNGIGKFYMGREIAHVMGYQAANWLERSEREEEERLSLLVKSLELKPGMTVADVGAGSGVITLMMAEAVGPKGKVMAVDIQDEMLMLLDKKLKRRKIDNVELVLGTAKSPQLKPNTIDLALMVDVYHEFEHPHEMLTELAKSLRPGGRIVFVEYRKEDPKVAIKEVHKMTEAQVKREAGRPEFGLFWKKTVGKLPLQHVVVFEKIPKDVPAIQAGAFAMDVTPLKFPISVNGNMRDAQATSAHDPLHARCLVLSDGTTTLAIAVCDSCMIPREVFDEAKKAASERTGIPVERMLLSATHAHSCPTVSAVFQSEPDDEYRKFLAGKIADGITEAWSALQPARVGWGVGRDETNVFNRRWFMKPGTKLVDPFGEETDQVKMNPGQGNAANDKPSGPTDPEVSFLSVQTADGRPLAFLANYSLHYVGGVPGATLSADYFGEFANRMALRLKATGNENPFVAMLSNGTSGNVNNVDFSATPMKSEPFERIIRVATSVSEAAFDAYEQIEHHSHLTLGMAEREVELGVRLPSEGDVLKAKKLLEGAGAEPYSKLPEVYARETLRMAEYPKTVKARLQAIRIGELGIVSNPCETFVETGLAIKKESPLKPTFVIELANGYNGYLPTPEHHKLGGYETWRARSSYLATDAEPKVRATLLELLQEVSRKSQAESKGNAVRP